MALNIVRESISNVKAEVIVKTVNNLLQDLGDDNEVIETAGLDELLTEKRNMNDLSPGQAVMVPAKGDDVRFIVHTMPPIWSDGNSGEEEVLKACYDNSLRISRMSGCKSVAFPLIAAEDSTFPNDRALVVAIRSISHFLLQHEMDVFLVIEDKSEFVLKGKIFQDVDEYIDENYEGRDLDEYGGFAIPEFLKHVKKQNETFFDVEAENDEDDRDSQIAVGQLGDSFQQRLFKLSDERNISDVELYKKANLSRKTFSMIRNNIDYQPSRKIAVALAIALRLNMRDAKDLIERAGYTFKMNRKFDVIIKFFIEHKVYNIYTVNMALFEYGQAMLGE